LLSVSGSKEEGKAKLRQVDASNLPTRLVPSVLSQIEADLAAAGFGSRENAHRAKQAAEKVPLKTLFVHRVVV